MHCNPGKKFYEEFLLFFFLLLFVAVPSCKKETSCEACRENNKPPIAIAGPDQVITLPTDSISLDGSASNDADGTISEWLWTKISGPAPVTIIDATSQKTSVKNLVAGTYRFELKVMDDKGLSSLDTMQVLVDEVFTSNHHPIANAGPDQTITLPVNSISLDGSASTDPDNNITNYLWAKISGPSSFSIAGANTVQTQVADLTQGSYQFELVVTDAGGLFSRDTMNVNVTLAAPQFCNDSNRPIINAQLIPVGNLSMSGSGFAVASAGNKILFAGGMRLQSDNSLERSSRVDIYDISTQGWSTAELSDARWGIAAAVTNNKIFFGGGEHDDGCCHVDVVDIFDASTNSWSISHMPAAGYEMAAVASGNKIFFGGADGSQPFTGINIYDITTQAWSTATLSEPKEHFAAAAANNKVYFAGGFTHRFPANSPPQHYASSIIDVYDNATSMWSTSSMSEGKTAFASIVQSGKIYWAGGYTGNAASSWNFSCVVEVNDVNTGNSSLQYLFKPGLWFNTSSNNAVVKEDKILFYRYNTDNYFDTNENFKFDIYNSSTNTWSIGLLPFSINGASIICVNNTIYVAGGWVNNGPLSNQVWKLEF
jgi:hypothetical protein